MKNYFRDCTLFLLCLFFMENCAENRKKKGCPARFRTALAAVLFFTYGGGKLVGL
jgi:hypothetical protein